MNQIGSARLIAGGKEMIPKVLALLEQSGIRTLGNPDVYLREYLHFGINEARELRERASLRAIRDGVRIFIVVCPGMTLEAQNALLKTIEEPVGNATFFLIVPTPETLLPTLLSRLQTLQLSGEDVLRGRVDARAFVSASGQKRISMLKPLLDRDENDRRDLGSVIAFLSDLERVIASHALKSGEGLRAIYRARKYVTDKGALTKHLLEQVALLVPPANG